ncbi:MAG TPA: hypothetical protein VGM36_06150 [Rhizomicrobium sp.]|jgi:hypothetical protein
MIAAVQAFEPRKLVGGAVVLILHLLVIAALLAATRWNGHQSEQTKEIILNLIAPKPLPKAEEKKPAPDKKTALPKHAPAFVPPATFIPPVNNSVPQLNGLNRQLFGCSPDQMATATAEERAACASASLGPQFDSGATDYRDHTDRSKNRVQWARDRARKNAPLLLPCMSPQAMGVSIYTLYCLGKAAVTGKFDKDDPGYQDMPDHIANEGDTRMAPVPH